MKYAGVLPPHSPSQLEPKLLLKVESLVYFWLGINFISSSVTISPSPEVLCRYPLQLADGHLVSREILCQLLALQQNRLVFLQCLPSQDVLRLGNLLICIHRRGDLKVLKHSAS